MALKLNTGPTTEPISLAEAKLHLRLDTPGLDDNLTSGQSIAPGSHIIAAAYSLKGTGIDVEGHDTVVYLEAGTNGAGGTVDVKLQESDTDVDVNYTDVVGGAFTQVTTLNDNATYEKLYAGDKKYLRAVATVANAACEFGVNIVTAEPNYSTEDTTLAIYIKAAREYCENFQNRAYLTQTWELWLDCFPENDCIEIPLPPLASVSSVKYYDTSNSEFTLDPSSYYVDTASEPGWLVLAYGYYWPSTALRPANGVCVTFVAGYGMSASAVPAQVRQAMLLLIGHLYEHRESVSDRPLAAVPQAVDALLWQNRVF